jgi:tRNA A-37 threonylcarbamoyl transferase component Bud32
MGVMENFPIVSPKVLLNLTNQGDAPFGLLLADQTILEVEAIVRRVANKRLVCQAKWHQKAVYAKLFLGVDAKRYAERDRRGAQYLLDAQIASPNIMYQGELDGVYVLIFESIPLAKNIEVVWQSSTQQARFKIAHLLVSTLAQHHRVNILQTDIYLKNFLLAGDSVFTIDGDGIRRFSTLTRAQATQNLAVLISKFDVIDASLWLNDLITSYHRTYADMYIDAQEVMRIASEHRTQVADAYATRKVFRQCSDVNVAKRQQYFSAISAEFSHLELPVTASIYDDWMASANVLKKGNTCTVAKMAIGNANLVIKRYNIKNISHAIGRMFRKSRAAISWSNAHRLTLLGLPTPKPIALLEERHMGWLRGKAYFVSELLDAPDVKNYFAITLNKETRAEAVKQIVLLFYRLYLLKISHGDMKATNIKMSLARPVLIDLDSMCQHRYSLCAKQAHIKDLKRFMQNWKDDASLYNAFVKTFKVIYPESSILQKAGVLDNKEIKD